jgi:hypothetical protein
VGVGSGGVERTALATLALLQAGSHAELAARGLDMLAANRDAYGTWGSLQSTLLALEAYLALPQERIEPAKTGVIRAYVGESASEGESDLEGGGGAEPVFLDDPVPGPHTRQFVDLDKGYNDLRVEVEGPDEVPYQMIGTYYLPWTQIAPSTPEEEEVSVEVSYDRTTLRVGEKLTVTVGVVLNRPGKAQVVLLELGLPPGLEPIVEEWDRLVVDGPVARYQRVDEQMLVYLADLSAEQPIQFAYHLHARYPVVVQTQPTRACDLANPQRPAIREPTRIEVLPADENGI